VSLIIYYVIFIHSTSQNHSLNPQLSQLCMEAIRSENHRLDLVSGTDYLLGRKKSLYLRVSWDCLLEIEKNSK
jgi:hypothetical protein